MVQIEDLIDIAIEKGASDIHLLCGIKPMLRIIRKLEPIEKYEELKEEETKKLLNLEENLHKRIIGQDEAVEAVSRAIRRNRAGLKSTKRPPSFIFVGPTGVGKTELAKALSYEMFGNEKSIIRFDMSEYMESNSTAKLIGAPPGYVGYDDAGQLTERVKRNPYSIILLDEIEKAHADVFNILLQVLDDGHRIIFCERDKTNINKLNNILSEAHYAKSVIIYECDLADKDRILNIAEKEKVDALIPVPLGKVFSTVGYINSQLNLPGVSYEACLNFTDKLKVYNLLKENNLNCASQWNATELDKVVFPCIVKPRFGCGSRGVKTAKNFNELLEACEFCRKDFSATIEDKDILIEEYIEGNEYSCEGITQNGKHYLLAFTKKYTTGAPNFIETGHSRTFAKRKFIFWVF